MKYLIDAQLPRRLCLALQEMGYDSIHTLNLDDQNRTKDRDINSISLNEKRVVISKDVDFIDSALISEKPYKLLYVATGNISNNNLLKLFSKHFREIDQLFVSHRLIELTPDTLIIHV